MQPALPDDRQIGTARSLEELQALLRGRFEELGYTRDTIDSLAGLQPGYAGKLFAPIPIKGIGGKVIPALLSAAAVKLVLVEDPEALSEGIEIRVKRQEDKVTASKAGIGGTTRADIEKMANRALRRRLRENAREGGKARFDSLGDSGELSKHQSEAATRRWAQWRRKRAEKRKRKRS